MKNLQRARTILYLLMVITLILVLYMSYQNLQTNKEIMETGNICKAYSEQDFSEVERICNIDRIEGLWRSGTPYGQKSWEDQQERIFENLTNNTNHS